MVSRRLRTVAVGLVVAMAAVGGVPAQQDRSGGIFPYPTHVETLDNGLCAILIPMSSNGLVAYWSVVRTGSRDEYEPGRSGFAHFFEHMMFRGGAKYGGTFDTVMEAAGGSNNAFTTHDTTVYQNWFPKEALPLILDMERDRMSGMVFEPSAVLAERDVVYSEFRLGREDPSERTSELLRATAYTVHPYHWDVIGWEADIKGWRQEDLEAFYSENYAPNNATLVIVGDVAAEDAFKAVETALGGVPRKPERRPIHSQEPEQLGERRVILEDPDAQLPLIKFAWHICATNDPDFPVWEVIEDVLLDGETARFQQVFVQDGNLCTSVGGGWLGYQFDPSLFSVEFAMRDGVPVEKAEALLHEEIAKFVKDGPTPRELTRVKNKIRAEFVRRLTTIDGKAALIGETDTFFGGWKNVGARVANIEKVTAEDVKRVAAKAFTAKNRTVCTLVIPESAGPGNVSPVNGGDK